MHAAQATWWRRIIDWMLTSGKPSAARVKAADLLEGVRAGQRLAAENCAYVGARGLFRSRGAEYVRRILSERYSAATR